MRGGRFYYAPVRDRWGVYKMTDSGWGELMEKYQTRGEARKRVFELNGWNFPKKP